MKTENGASTGLYLMFTKVNIPFHLMFSCENISFVLRTHRCSFALQTHRGSATENTSGH